MASSPSTAPDSFELATAQLKPGTVAIITGGAEGMGKSFAEGLLEKGAKGVSLADVNEPMGVETQRELAAKFGEGRVMFVKCDVTSSSDMDVLFAKTKEAFGCVNLMVNNAGIMNEQKPELCVNINAWGVVKGTYNAIKYMSPEEGGLGGKIINISSYAALVIGATAPVYCGTKHFVNAFTMSLVGDPLLAAQGITFAILCPTYVDTSMITKEAYRNPVEDKEQSLKLRAQHGILEVSAVRNAFLQLVLDEAWSGKIMTISKSHGIQPAP